MVKAITLEYTFFFLFIVMDHKYKALLQNIPTRHVITAIAPVPDQAKQIEKLRNLDINNFFVLGTLSSISGILGNDFILFPNVICGSMFFRSGKA